MCVHACRCDFVYVCRLCVLVKWQIKLFIIIIKDDSTLSNQLSRIDLQLITKNNVFYFSQLETLSLV